MYEKFKKYPSPFCFLTFRCVSDVMWCYKRLLKSNDNGSKYVTKAIGELCE